jgi:hypothetical protein
MSALPPKADIRWRQSNVRFVPKADMLAALTPEAFSLGAAYCLPARAFIHRVSSSSPKSSPPTSL